MLWFIKWLSFKSLSTIRNDLKWDSGKNHTQKCFFRFFSKHNQTAFTVKVLHFFLQMVYKWGNNRLLLKFVNIFLVVIVDMYFFIFYKSPCITKQYHLFRNWLCDYINNLQHDFFKLLSRKREQTDQVFHLRTSFIYWYCISFNKINVLSGIAHKFQWLWICSLKTRCFDSQVLCKIPGPLFS